MEHKIDKATAESEFERFTDSMDILIDEGSMDEDDLSAFLKIKARLIRAMQNGSLMINENGEAEYTPCRPGSPPETLIFHERTGASIMAMDGKKKGHDAAKMYSVMGDMCRVHQNIFSKLVGSDIKVCEAIFGLLMD